MGNSLKRKIAPNLPWCAKTWSNETWTASTTASVRIHSSQFTFSAWQSLLFSDWLYSISIRDRSAKAWNSFADMYFWIFMLFSYVFNLRDKLFTFCSLDCETFRQKHLSAFFSFQCSVDFQLQLICISKTLIAFCIGVNFLASIPVLLHSKYVDNL